MRLIVSADDFGVSEQVNAAVARAAREGVLTSASLMVTGEAASQAVALAKDAPRLAVGLHLTLSDGSSVLPYRAISQVVNAESRFADSPVRAAIRYYFDRRAWPQLVREIWAQFEAFAQTGLRLSHVDGHQHLHAHPAVFPTVVEMARRYGAVGIRTPRDPLWMNLRVDRSGLGAKAIVALGHAYLAGVCRRLLPGSGLATCDAVVGSLMSGRMTPRYVFAMLDRLNCRGVEMFFHPSETDSGQRCGPGTGDLRTLLDPALKAYIDKRGCEMTTYAGIGNREQGTGNRSEGGCA